jgi:DnaJ-class molecular chaperone
MKIFQLLSLLLLLVILAMAWATWDMQRREAAAPGVDLGAVHKSPTSSGTTDTPPPAVTPAKTNAVVVIPKVACPTCQGKKEVPVEKEVMCRACGGEGFLPGAGASRSATVCNSCRGNGKTYKATAQECPTCKQTGQLAQSVAAEFKPCPKCQGAKTVTVETQATCQSCRGSGKVVGELTKKTTGACPFCNGTGKLDRKDKRICPDCFGSGVTHQPPPPPQPGT